MLHLQSFFPYKISRLDNDLSTGLHRLYASRFKLNITQWRMLAAAAQLEPTSVTELTDYSGMDKVTVSRSIREMVDRRLLDRTLDESDRRRAAITLTPAGLAVYEQIAPEVVKYEADLMAVLSPDEQAALHRTLDKLLDQLGLMRQSRSRVFPQRAEPASPPLAGAAAGTRPAASRRAPAKTPSAAAVAPRVRRRTAGANTAKDTAAAK